ncbi:hypothetical protein Krac_0175 [Ktedonobacter racemifer DSM 44963]|uniref:Uncharacterized protein n=1 Tax=Ktedonobacter racemifer DSM 44963 TaxID=485913 RepID=D6U727_KTERA|nr:hypothetical protein Krac_0175 [Ktedonobacter racemifer DSM 44963]
MYFIFGTLSGSDPIDYLIFIQSPIREYVDGTFETTYSTIPRVMKALETYFHLPQEEQIAFLHQFASKPHRRFDEVYPRNIPGFEEHFPYFDDEPF